MFKSFQKSFGLKDVKKFHKYGNSNFSVQERTTIDNQIRDGWNAYIVNTNKNFFDQNKLYLKSMQDYMTLEMPNRHRDKKATGPKISVMHNKRQKKMQGGDPTQDVPRMAAAIDSVSSLSRSESREKVDKKSSM